MHDSVDVWLQIGITPPSSSRYFPCFSPPKSSGSQDQVIGILREGSSSPNRNQPLSPSANSNQQVPTIGKAWAFRKARSLLFAWEAWSVGSLCVVYSAQSKMADICRLWASPYPDLGFDGGKARLVPEGLCRVDIRRI